MHDAWPDKVSLLSIVFESIESNLGFDLFLSKLKLIGSIHDKETLSLEEAQACIAQRDQIRDKTAGVLNSNFPSCFNLFQ